MEVVLASANPGKLRELTALLAPLGWRLRAQSELGVDPAEESGETFAANALIKARHAASRAGLAALADDSGIEVDALGGRPGVRSARYAREGASDRENLEKLLRELDGVPAARRSARYRCAIAYVERHDDPHPVIAQGCWEGRIAAVARGSGGFGYDPIFLPSGLGCTAAELAPAEKDRVSHRAQALAALLARMRGAPGN